MTEIIIFELTIPNHSIGLKYVDPNIKRKLNEELNNVGLKTLLSRLQDINYIVSQQLIEKQVAENQSFSAKQNFKNKENRPDLEAECKNVNGKYHWTFCFKKLSNISPSYQNILESLPTLITRYWIKEDGSEEFEYSNNYKGNLFITNNDFYEPSEIWKLIHKEDIPKIQLEFTRSAKELDLFQYTYRLNTDEGVRWIRTLGNPEKHPEGGFVWSIFSYDVTKEYNYKRLLNQASQVAKVGAWQHDLETNLSTWSDVTRQIFEEEELGKQYSGKEILEFSYKKKDLRIHTEKTKLAIEKGEAWDIEFRIKTKKGNIKWIRSIGRPEYIAGKLLRIYGSVQDIDTIKRLEIENKKSLKEKTKIIDSIQDAFYVVDKKWHIKYWNKISAKYSGITKDQAIGKNLWTLYPESNWKPMFEKAMKVQEGLHHEAYSNHWQIWCEVHLFPFKNGMSVSIRDINERVQQAEELKRSNDRYRMVAESSSDALYDWNILKDDVKWSEGLKRLYGFDPKDFNTFQHCKNQIIDQDKKQVEVGLEQALNDPSVYTWKENYQFIKANGEIAYVSEKGVIERDDNGKALRMVGAKTDISQTKLYQLALKTHAKELELSNQELEEFAYVASHDLQEPLRTISNFLSRLKEKHASKLNADANQYIDFSINASEKLKTIVYDLLEYSRVGKHNDKLEEINLDEVVEEVILLNEKLIKEKNGKVVFNQLPKIEGFRTPFVRVFHNLINNSLKYAKQDVPSIINITYELKKDNHFFSISDNGIGIDKRFEQKIFQIFKRLHLDSQYEGKGLGLSIVKKLINQMGGKIWLDEPDHEDGTKISFEIPVIHPTAKTNSIEVN